MHRLSTFILLALIQLCVVAQTTKVLFVGNSLTYTNNLPSLVEKEAKSKGFKIKASMVALPNYALIDHWDDGEIQKRIMNGKYDYVIVQQGPSSQEEGRRMLREDGAKISALCERYETRLVYFMVWPSRTYYYTYDGVIRNHRDAAEENNALLCPVGEVWKAHFDATEDYSYYGPDGFHPSLRGSQVAAETIVTTLFGE